MDSPTPPDRRALEAQEDARLVIRAQSGDNEGFAALYERYFSRVFAHLNVVAGNREDAEDLAQQVFAQAFAALPGYESAPGRPFRHWLFRIARNTFLNHARKHARYRVEEGGVIDRRRDRPSEVDLSALGWITDAEVLLFVERLSPSQRQVITLRYVLDLEFGEIARILGHESSAVRQLHRRAMAFLEQRLTALGRKPARAGLEGMRILIPQASVLRARRFALLR